MTSVKRQQLRPRVIRPVTRGAGISYFQMHIFDQERVRLQAEKREISKRLKIIEERVKFLTKEIERFENALKLKADKR